MKRSDLNIKQFVNSDFVENLYVVHRKGVEKCVLIDPGMGPDDAIGWIKKHRLVPVAILLTHGHYDHIGGLDAMKEEFPDAVVMVGEKDRYKLTDPSGNLSGYFGFPLITRDADRSLTDGETFIAAGICFETVEIPGHSAGHVVYKIACDDGDVVFVGDVIFAGSVGRTDLPDGNTDALISGIKTRLFNADDKTRFYPGHGPATDAATEKRIHPWLKKRSFPVPHEAEMVEQS